MLIGRTVLELVQSDITRLDVDAIVNAANTTLLGGGGVDGAIHRVAGPELLAECRTLGGCATGQARITRGYRLRARHVIHAVGPVYRGNRRAAPLLASAVRESLRLADAHGLRSLALPAISTGVYGYPMAEAARVILATIVDYLGPGDTTLERVLMSLYDRPAYDVFAKELQTLLGQPR